MLLSFTSRFDIDLQATSTSPAAKATSAKPAAADNSAVQSPSPPLVQAEKEAGGCVGAGAVLGWREGGVRAQCCVYFAALATLGRREDGVKAV